MPTIQKELLGIVETIFFLIIIFLVHSLCYILRFVLLIAVVLYSIVIISILCISLVVDTTCLFPFLTKEELFAMLQ